MWSTVRAKWMAVAGAVAGAVAACVRASGGGATAGQRVRTERLDAGGRRQCQKAKAAPAVSRAQMELAQEMVGDSYAMGQRLETRQRVALMTRLLYTMRPEVMAAEKKQWAEELFGLAQQLPGWDGGGDGDG